MLMLRCMPLVLVTALFATACTSVDAERDRMRGTLRDARTLTVEIDAWHGSMTRATDSPIPSSVLKQLDSFRDRAEELHDVLTGFSDEARTGRDLRSVELALDALASFEADGFDSASRDGREAILNQFGNRAESLGDALDAVREPAATPLR